jgi:hypothetical protein
VESIKRERVYDELVGVYESYMGIILFKVKRSSGFLWIEFKDRHIDQILPIIPGDIDGPIKRFDLVSLDRRIPIEFIEINSDKYMIYERYKLRKANLL